MSREGTSAPLYSLPVGILTLELLANVVDATFHVSNARNGPSAIRAIPLASAVPVTDSDNGTLDMVLCVV